MLEYLDALFTQYGALFVDISWLRTKDSIIFDEEVKITQLDEQKVLVEVDEIKEEYDNFLKLAEDLFSMAAEARIKCCSKMIIEELEKEEDDDTPNIHRR